MFNLVESEIKENRNQIKNILQIYILLQIVLIGFTIIQKIDVWGSLRFVSQEFGFADRGVDLTNIVITSLMLLTIGLFIWVNIINNRPSMYQKLISFNIPRITIFNRKILFIFISLFVFLVMFYILYLQWLVIVVYSEVPSMHQLYYGNAQYSIHESIISIRTTIIMFILMGLFSIFLILFIQNQILYKMAMKYGMIGISDNQKNLETNWGLLLFIITFFFWLLLFARQNSQVILPLIIISIFLLIISSILNMIIGRQLAKWVSV